MKRLISDEVARRGLQDNIKLGPGGIREIEFVTQAFQLVRGGQQPELRDRRLTRVLGKLRELDILPEHAARELRDAYGFLRASEHRLQQVNDQQVHTLPDGPAARRCWQPAWATPTGRAIAASSRHTARACKHISTRCLARARRCRRVARGAQCPVGRVAGARTGAGDAWRHRLRRARGGARPGG